MIQQQTIIDLVNKATQGTELFLVEVKVTPANKILVFLDSEKGVTIDDCSRISRYVESNLNRDVEDFELNVSSFGLDQPLKLIRQYKKNIGKYVSVLLKDGIKQCGKLLTVNENEIEIEFTQNKKPNKSKIAFSDIKEVKIVISFS